MPTVVDTSGIDRLAARFQMLINPDPTPVLIRIADLMDQDNRRGILNGLDRNDVPLAAVTYRPVSAKTGKPVKNGAKLTVEQRLGQNPKLGRGRYSRLGSGEEHTNNNLTNAEYRLLSGPPLAPRRQFSRVITNYMQSYGRTSVHTWEVIGAWIDVLSPKGVPFLTYHFNGIGQRMRDLRGIRPDGVRRIRETIRKWMISEIQSG